MRKRLLEVVLLLTVMAGLSGCSGFHQLVLPNRTKPGNVYMFAGIWDFSAGTMREVAKRLSDEGYNSQWVAASQSGTLAHELLRARSEGTLDGPVILVGYSMGGAKTIAVARELQQSHMDIDAIVVVDGFPMSEIPGNVKSCYNIYRSGLPPVYLGGTVKCQSQATEIINLDISESQDEALRKFGVMHWNLIMWDSVQELIVQSVHRYLPGAPTTAPMTNQTAAHASESSG